MKFHHSHRTQAQQREQAFTPLRTFATPLTAAPQLLATPQMTPPVLTLTPATPGLSSNTSLTNDEEWLPQGGSALDIPESDV
jgi:hypothetical protein